MEAANRSFWAAYRETRWVWWVLYSKHDESFQPWWRLHAFHNATLPWYQLLTHLISFSLKVDTLPPLPCNTGNNSIPHLSEDLKLELLEAYARSFCGDWMEIIHKCKPRLHWDPHKLHTCSTFQKATVAASDVKYLGCAKRSSPSSWDACTTLLQTSWF